MPKAYSRDLRERVITAVEAGASRREAAERFEVSVASAVKWLRGNLTLRSPEGAEYPFIPDRSATARHRLPRRYLGIRHVDSLP